MEKNIPINSASKPGLTPQDLVNQQKNEALNAQKAKQAEQQELQKIAKNKVYKAPKPLKTGSLIAFKYNFYKNDPSPLCLVSDINVAEIKGINLHYLTINVMKSLLQRYGEKEFSYFFIKNNAFVKSSFRNYKRMGIKNMKILDVEMILSLVGVARSFKPNEVNAIRKSVRDQLNKGTTQPSVNQLNQGIYQ